MPFRVLPGGHTPGQTIIADALGNGDYNTIQAALNAAYSQSPTATNRWLVIVAPGLYPENLTLYDYVDLAGLAPVPSCYVKPPSGPAIANAAMCTLCGLRLGAVDSPVISLSAAGGPLALDLVTIDEPALANYAVYLNGDADLHMRHCTLKTGWTVMRQTTGLLTAGNTRFENANPLAASGTQAVLSFGQSGIATFERCTAWNASAGGGPAAALPVQPTTILSLLNCILRAEGGTYAVTAAQAGTAAVIAQCLSNLALDSKLDAAFLAGNVVIEDF